MLLLIFTLEFVELENIKLAKHLSDISTWLLLM
jgi:hypothetical protein